eukprot:706956-Amphidinium_carterae.2
MAGQKLVGGFEHFFCGSLLRHQDQAGRQSSTCRLWDASYVTLQTRSESTCTVNNCSILNHRWDWHIHELLNAAGEEALLLAAEAKLRTTVLDVLGLPNS